MEIENFIRTDFRCALRLNVNFIVFFALFHNRDMDYQLIIAEMTVKIKKCIVLESRKNVNIIVVKFLAAIPTGYYFFDVFDNFF